MLTFDQLEFELIETPVEDIKSSDRIVRHCDLDVCLPIIGENNKVIGFSRVLLVEKVREFKHPDEETVYIDLSNDEHVYRRKKGSLVHVLKSNLYPVTEALVAAVAI